METTMKKIFFSLTLALSFIIPSLAHARIDIVPQKIVIDPRERGGEFTILNLYDVKGTFRIELLNFEQNENGIYKELEGPLNPNFDPEKIVRFSPRQFSIEPGGRQKVRLSLRKPADLPEGEYRFHAKAIRLTQDDERKNTDGTVQVIMNMGITIPVIVRHGQAASEAKISNPQLVPAPQTKNTQPELQLDILREGNASAIGKIEVFWHAQGKSNKKIGLVSNANVFTEINKRHFKIPLGEMPTGNGNLLIRYSDEVNKGKIIDEVTIQR